MDEGAVEEAEDAAGGNKYVLTFNYSVGVLCPAKALTMINADSCGMAGTLLHVKAPCDCDSFDAFKAVLRRNTVFVESRVVCCTVPVAVDGTIVSQRGARCIVSPGDDR